LSKLPGFATFILDKIIDERCESLKPLNTPHKVSEMKFQH
jgi:hypothetical protein